MVHIAIGVLWMDPRLGRDAPRPSPSTMGDEEGDPRAQAVAGPAPRARLEFRSPRRPAPSTCRHAPGSRRQSEAGSHWRILKTRSARRHDPAFGKPSASASGLGTRADFEPFRRHLRGRGARPVTSAGPAKETRPWRRAGGGDRPLDIARLWPLGLWKPSGTAALSAGPDSGIPKDGRSRKWVGRLSPAGARPRARDGSGAASAPRTLYDNLGWTTAVSLISLPNQPSIAVAERLGARMEADNDVFARSKTGIFRHPRQDWKT